MEKKDNKKIIFIALYLMTLMIASMVLLPNISAHSPSLSITSYAYLSVAPNPVGVGQSVAIAFWVDYPLQGSTLTNDIRRHDYTLTIAKPDGTEITQKWPVISDTTGIQSHYFTPDQVGIYTVKFYYAGQTYTWNQSTTPGLDATSATYYGDVFTPANATTTFNAQTDPIPEPISGFPLPTEYWTRPIEGRNTNWFTVASNWYSVQTVANEPLGRYQPDGTAPNSSHIMWTKPVAPGGVIGGNNSLGLIQGDTYYNGQSYATRALNPIIMDGKLYYPLPLSQARAGGGTVCLDLRTGQQIWYANLTQQTFGQILDYQDPNQHGGMSPLLWYTSGTTWVATDATTGATLFNLTNVPSGYTITGPNGELLIYQIDSTRKWLALWNTTMVWNGTSQAIGNIMLDTYGSLNASKAYSWNISIPNLGTGTWTVNRVFDSDLLLLTQGWFGARNNYGDVVDFSGANITAISLRPQSLGSILWTKHYDVPDGQVYRLLGAIDNVNRVFVFRDKETLNLWGYSLDTGNFLWGPVKISDSPWTYQQASIFTYFAYGNLYCAGMDGVVRCFDIKTGQAKWTYGNGDAGNSTNSGLYTPYGVYPIEVGIISDGKIYTISYEHTANSPLYKGYEIIALDAYTGNQLWRIPGFVLVAGGGIAGTLDPSMAIADGYLVYLNAYDTQFYCIGKGPTQTTVSAPDIASPVGTSIVIKGSVMDISSGSKQNQQVTCFPNGLPAVSESNMTAWMEYVYMQKPKPTNTVGVPVSIDVIDSNGNYRNIGITNSDSSGTFSLQWKPDIPGKYTVIATFTGSESYWSSSSETSFAVDPAAPTAVPTSEPIQSAADMYFVPAIAGLFVLVIVVAIVLALLLLRKRP
jgi:hypothetical protein